MDASIQDVINATVADVFERHNIRMVGHDQKTDEFGDTIYIVHGHLMDMMNCRSVDDVLNEIILGTSMRVVYSLHNNAILIKE